MTLLTTFGGDSAVDTGDITKSLRFRASGSTYMSRTPAGATNRKTWTFSCWVKRGTLTTDQVLLSAGTTDTTRTLVYLRASVDDIVVLNNTGAAYYGRYTNAVSRDPSGHFHLLVAMDTTQATAADRVKIYVNGTLQSTTSPAGDIPLNADTYINSTIAHYIGRNSSTATQYLDGYLSRICFVDGQALTPSSFGSLNTEINEWITKSASQINTAVVAGGGWGNNGDLWDFDDGTSLTTLGYGKFNSKNWTLTNHSLSGVTFDHMSDVPGNSYPTINPINVQGNTTLSEANLKHVSTSGAAYSTSVATQAIPTTGDWWAEVTFTGTGANGNQIGLLASTRSIAASTASTATGTFSDGYAYSTNGNKVNNGSGSAYGATLATGDVIGVLKTEAGALTFYKQTGGTGNFVSQGTAYTGLTSSFVFSCGALNNDSWQWNFGQRPFNYVTQHGSLPSSALALCQANLPEGAVRNPKKHFDAKTRTGTAATYSVTGIEFQPDFVWVKSRGRAVDHALYDSVRGVEKRLEANNTDAEVTGDTTGLTAFNSAGYTGGALDQINGTTATNSFIDWLWKANGAAVSNTNGTITSQVSANTTAGFSVATFTTVTATAGTIGHGLGGVPELIIMKCRGSSGVSLWGVYHVSTTAAGYLQLNSTAAYIANTPTWNNTTPTSTVFSIGNGWGTGDNFVAYCFRSIPGYQKIGSYTGNGSADGPFVFCGFKPRWILIKASTASPAGGWVIYDSARNTYNVMTEDIRADLANAAPVSSGPIDVTAMGFKLRGTDTNTNGGSNSYVYLAIADVNAKYSNSR